MVRYVGYVYYFIVDDSILNMSVGSLFESGYDGDMEDEGDLNVDEEFCSELVDDQYGVLNKQFKDFFFFNWEEFLRMSFILSIFYLVGIYSGFDFEV